MWTKLEALEELSDCDHAFLNREGCNRIAGPFGLIPRCYEHRANPRDPKGLTLKDGAKKAVGLGAEELAGQICQHLGLGRPDAAFHGRGSQLRACVDAIREKLGHE